MIVRLVSPASAIVHRRTEVYRQAVDGTEQRPWESCGTSIQLELSLQQVSRFCDVLNINESGLMGYQVAKLLGQRSRRLPDASSGSIAGA
jgi:hypothetical protein